MDIQIEAGVYVLAVSGGVDSVVLLDLLSKKSGLNLVVAHFDHGIRPESAEDRNFVQALAEKYNQPFVYAEGHLGADASEATARTARYKFLRQTLEANESKAIITAHHQDDLLETAILNMLRGTGRKGLTSLKSQGDIARPLLGVSKNSILKYAKRHNLEWREDPSNQNVSYQRNYVRHKIMPRFTAEQRGKLVNMLSKLQNTNEELDILLSQILDSRATIDRYWFSQLPYDVAKEIMATWLRTNKVGNFDRKGLEKLVVAAKTAPAGKQFPVLGKVKMRIGKADLALEHAER